MPKVHITDSERPGGWRNCGGDEGISLRNDTGTKVAECVLLHNNGWSARIFPDPDLEPVTLYPNNSERRTYTSLKAAQQICEMIIKLPIK